MEPESFCFTCPDCAAGMTATRTGLACPTCRRRIRKTRGIYQFLSREHRAAILPFLAQYRDVRARDGHRRADAEYYRALPEVPPDDVNAGVWRIRRASYRRLRDELLGTIGVARPAAVDLGAGCGWLSHRLAGLGYRALAVDWLADPQDGLGVCRLYPVPVAAAQADFLRLPLAARQFDVAIFNGSLHYAPEPEHALAEARRVAKSDGTLVVMDSPMFERDTDGMRMLDDADRSLAAAHAHVFRPVRPGVGYLTFDGLAGACRRLGLRWRFLASDTSVGGRLRRLVRSACAARPGARFGVWIARPG